MKSFACNGVEMRLEKMGKEPKNLLQLMQLKSMNIQSCEFPIPVFV